MSLFLKINDNNNNNNGSKLPEEVLDIIASFVVKVGKEYFC